MTAKVYVDVLAVFSREGELIPTAFVWEDGRKYAIDKVSKPERCACLLYTSPSPRDRG